MNDADINDIRLMPDFKGKTFSEFKKTDVKRELLKSLYNSRIEPACYWSAELLCAGHFSDMWDIIIEYYTKHIHIGNPGLLSYLEFRINNFKNIVQGGYLDQELRMRNNPHVRQLFGEIMCVLCDARKRRSFSDVKVRQEDFDLTQLSERLSAPRIDFATALFLEDDPKEIFIAVNEFAFHLSSEGKNSVAACYWLAWILQFDALCKRKGTPLQCHRRVFAPVDSQFQMELVWIVWDALLHESRRQSEFVQRIVASGLNLFSLKFAPAAVKKRRLLLYFMVELFTEPFTIETNIVRNKPLLTVVLQNLPNIYKQIKTNEVCPDTSYLFADMKQSNFDKTIAQLEAMDQLGTSFVPRV